MCKTMEIPIWCARSLYLKWTPMLQITQTRHPKSVTGGQTDGRSGPITRPAFTKAMLVKQAFAHRRTCDVLQK